MKSFQIEDTSLYSDQHLVINVTVPCITSYTKLAHVKKLTVYSCMFLQNVRTTCLSAKKLQFVKDVNS